MRLFGPGYIERMRWHQHLGFLLDDVAYLYARRFEEHTRELSLTLHQCKALAVLANCGAINQTRLAEISEIDPVRLARILDWLEVVGWAERRSDPSPQGRPTASARLAGCRNERLFTGHESHNRRCTVDCAFLLDGDRILPWQRNAGSFNQVIEEGAYLER
jgi:hypothetical protein